MNGKSKNVELHSVKDCVQNVPFEDLAPATNVDISNYEQVLNQAFSSPRLKNIAITGPYGAGKSSILASYLQSKEASDKNYANLCLRISLAHFQPTKSGNELTDEQGLKPVLKDGEAVSSSYQMEQLLEGKIINQILHKIPAKVAKAAGFKMVDMDNEIKSNAFSWLTATITGILLVYLFIPPLAAPVVRHFAPSYNNLFLLILLVLAIVFIAIAVSFSYIHGKDIKTFFSHFQRVKIEGNEIELFQDKDAAYFDKYLDSILYIIDHSGKQFFIFEDIDRFDTTLIFERLKEINELVNAKRKLRQEAPIKFIYLLRDDIFLNKDRAKFFDFLIPIIPVTNTKNSSDKLFAILERYRLKEQVNPDLVRALGLYIEDYRLIKNIANEFRIYFAALGQRNKLNPDKMLSMIVYKNLFPKDFVDLQKQQGYVHFLLSKAGKVAFVFERKKELEKEKKEYAKQLESIKNESLDDFNELAWAIIGTKYNKDAWGSRYLSNNTSKDLSELEQYIQNDNGIGQKAKEEYKRRKENLRIKNEYKIDAVSEKWRECDKKIVLLDGASYSVLASMFIGKINQVFLQNERDNNGNEISYDAVRQNEYFNLLKYLLINGYLDETYAEYTTFFYGESLSEADQTYLMNLHENGSPKWGLQLNNIPLVLENMSETELSRAGVLNQAFLLYLLSRLEDEGIYQKMEKVVRNFKGDSFSYAIQFILADKKVDAFATCLFRTCPSSWGRIYTESNLSADTIEALAYDALLFLSEEELTALNQQSANSLAQYISDNLDFLQRAQNMDEGKQAKLISSMKVLKVQFSDIHAEGVSKKLLHDVFYSGLYALSGNTLRVFFTDVSEASEADAITKPLTLLWKLSEDDSVRKDIESRFAQFVNAALDNLAGYSSKYAYFTDKSDMAVALTNQKRGGDEAAMNYLSRLMPETVVSLSEIEEYDDWKLLVAHDLVKHTEQNLYEYINQFGVDDTLIECLNSSYAKSPLICTSLGENEQMVIQSAIIPECTIDTNVYISILDALDYPITEQRGLDAESFPEEKLRKLIQERRLAMNPNLFNFFQKRHPQLLTSYVKNDKNTFEQLMEEGKISLTSSDIGLFLQDSSYTDEEKELYLGHTEGPVALLPYRNLSEKIQCIIVDYHLDEAEIPKLIGKYESLRPKVCKAFLRAVNQHIKPFIGINMDDNGVLLRDIMQSSYIDKENKVRILIGAILTLDMEKAKDMLSAIDVETYGKILKSGATRHIKETPDAVNQQLFEVLKERGWIKGYEMVGNEYIIERNFRLGVQGNAD